ncbi:hypothetical protein [Streptomyces marianii]|uniref:Uncharacterized protein n=1 Tax=Streptomyces marianii TaxID=1817406 RepID=A0A5R9EFW7_9ACTN|nr:hypothetical protein [Streptomyces marianii]TLQ47699.1 hypothetical protein FEF34_36425 [Streptomyces marianii]
MTSTPTATHSIEATTALLQAELPQLEEQQITLQKELAAVSERLETVRAALAALSALSATVVPAPRAAEPVVEPPLAEEVPAEPVTDVAAAAGEPVTGSAVPDDTAELPPAVEDGTATKSGRPRASRKSAAASKPSKAKRPTASASRRRPAKNAPTTPAKSVKSKAKTAGTARRSAASTAPAEAAPESGGLTEQVIAVLTRHADTALRARDVAQALGRDDSAGNINTVRSTLDRLVATSRAHRAGRGLYQSPTG